MLIAAVTVVLLTVAHASPPCASTKYSVVPSACVPACDFDNKYIVSPATSTTDTACRHIAVCNPDYSIELEPPTVTADRRCSDPATTAVGVYFTPADIEAFSTYTAILGSLTVIGSNVTSLVLPQLQAVSISMNLVGNANLTIVRLDVLHSLDIISIRHSKVICVLKFQNHSCFVIK